MRRTIVHSHPVSLILRVTLLHMIVMGDNSVFNSNETRSRVLVLLPGRKGDFLFPFGKERTGAAGNS